jgi:D-galactarolactone cycloisomerase
MLACREQRSEDFTALAELRRTGAMPIAAGENAGSAVQFAQMLRVDYAQPSVTKIGGISELRKVLALAEAANVRVAPHSPYFGPGLLADPACPCRGPQEMLVSAFRA